MERIIHSLVQGSPEWLAHRAQYRNASDAPAMMGCSPYRSRNELLQELATGVSKEIDAATQRRFNDGHAFEALARPLAEELIGSDLYPVSVSFGRLAASLDGLTMAEDIAWEHKTLNDELRAVQSIDDLGLHYKVQMEQQLYVSGATKCLFTASKWDADQLVEAKHLWYESDPELRARILAAWEQFDKDLAAYVPVEVLPAAVAAPTMGLPSLSIQVNGSISLISNLDIFGQKLTAFIEGIDRNPSDDQAFADCEAAVKVLQKAQDALEAAEAGALAQTASIDEMRKTVEMYRETARTTRLMLEKLVKARKETIRIEIQQAAKDKATAHIASLNQRLGKPYMPQVAVDFATAMKGKKTVSSLRDAVDTELANFKIAANEIADRIQFNLETLRELASGHAFLFADAAQIVLKAPDDCTALVKLRIAEHQQAEEKRMAAERERIAAEERKKADDAVRREQEEAERKAHAEQEAAARAELAVAKTKDEGAELSPAAQALNEQEGAARFASSHPSAARLKPAPAAKRGMPSAGAIVSALASYYSVSEATAREWLSAYDFAELGKPALESAHG